MMTIINTAVWSIWKLRVNTKSSHHKKKNIFSLFFPHMQRRLMLTKLIGVIISQYVSKVIMLYTVNLYRVASQLYLNKTENQK